MRKFVACMIALCMMSCSVPVVAEDASPAAAETVVEEISVVEESQPEEEAPATEETDAEEAPVVEEEVQTGEATPAAEETDAEEAPAVEENSDFVIEDVVLVAYLGTDADVIVPEEVTEIGKEAFAGNEDIESIHFAGAVVTIGPKAFADCINLEEISFEDIDELKTIESKAFAGCEKLNSDWANDIEDVADDAFDVEEAEAPEEEEIEAQPVEIEQTTDADASEVSETEATLAITSQPQSVELAVGETAQFTVAADGEGLTYRWEILKAGSASWAGTTMPGNRTATLSVEATLARSGNQYRCVVTDANGNTVTSDAAMLTVTDSTFEITSQPQSVSLTVGETAQFTVEATGDGLSYRWYILKPNSETWAVTSMPGNRTATLSIAATLERSGYQYRCIITDANGNTLTSDAATLTVTEAFAITSQPQSVELTVGETAQFTVVANGENLTYRWQILKAGSTSWAGTTMSGNRTATLSVEATLERSGNQYRCIVTDANGNTVTSDAATLTVTDSTAFEITSQPQSVSLTAGETAQFTVVANGDGLSYRWYILKPGSASWAVTGMPGCKTDTLSVEATLERSGYQYRCIVTDANGNTVTSDAATLTVAEAFTITSQPQSVELAAGETAQFTVVANGDGLSYRWYILKPNSASWAVTGMPGCKTDTLSVEATLERSGNQYRCIVTDANGNTVTSDAATLTVTDSTPFEITSQPQSVELPVGQTAQFTVEATGNGLTYRWYILKPNSETWAVTSMPGNRTATLSIAATLERSGYQYRCIITDASGNTLTSDAAMLTVTEATALEITAQPQSAELAVGETAQFTVVANGDGLTYRWYILKPNSETWAVTGMPGCKTDTLSVEATLERNGYQYRCVITDASGNTVTSDAAMLTIVSDITLDDVVYEKTSDTTVSVKSYAGSAATVVIPETVEGYTVTAIGESAFEGNTVLTSIDLPDTIQVIGKRAFANCTSLSEMN